VSQRKLTPAEVRYLQEALGADCKPGNLRLREGEYQYGLVKAITTFQLGLYFPDVRDIIKTLYGEEKTSDLQFVRKVQTILKKMEKSNIVRILPKKKPWELQRYALSSFKFQDIDKNLVVLATEEQLKQAENLLRTTTSEQKIPVTRWGTIKMKVYTIALIFAVAVSYGAIVWDVAQPIISPFVFIFAFSIAVAGSVMLGRILSER